MLPAALRPLLVLIAVFGALTALGADSSRPDVAQRRVAPMASPQTGHGSNQDSEWLGLAVLGEPAPVPLAGMKRPGRGPCSTDEGLDGLPQPKHTVPALDPRRCGAFAPGESPAALAFLRVNGSANAGGAGT